jgi:DNA-binding transcriptional regulator YhcF (GntR family)
MELKRQGYCDLSQREIARRAEVNMRTGDRKLDSLAEAGMIGPTPNASATLTARQARGTIVSL